MVPTFQYLSRAPSLPLFITGGVGFSNDRTSLGTRYRWRRVRSLRGRRQRNGRHSNALEFLMGWLLSLWHFVFGWPSVAILIGAAATAIAVLEPPAIALVVPNLRRSAIIVAVVAFSITAIMGKYYNDGLNEIKAQVDAGLASEAVQGEAAHDDAVHAVDVAGPGGLRDDRWNRDLRNRKSAGGK
jgi:hypothetical protein